MKVETHTQPKPFTPVTFTVTCETEEELRDLREAIQSANATTYEFHQALGEAVHALKR